MGDAAPVRLLFSDVDRTLLTQDHRLPDEIVAAVGRARAAGLKMVLATARSPRGVAPYARRLGLADLVICFNGGWIGSLDERPLETLPLEREPAVEAMRLAAGLGIHPMWYGDDAIYALDADPVTRREAETTHERLVVVADPAEIPGAPGKIMCVRTDLARPDEFDAMRAAFGGVFGIVPSHARLLEINPPGVGKAVGAARAARHLGIDAAHCAAAGDAENDLAMLRWAAVPITVANGLPELRALAAHVGRSCDEAGMAGAIDWLLARR
ncbi:MAG: HAD family hydrolase [Rhizobiales bacterium]|nr:HAD family hydrolase [Hyphomicrobiales bacterium]